MTGTRVRSQFLVFLMFTSTMLALVGPASTVSAENETTSGAITGTETWSGSHELTGDLTIAAGAKLIINPGTEISLPNGTSIDVRGNLCAGLSSCGSSGDASEVNPITFTWNDPLVNNSTGDCYGLGFGSSKIWINDPSCGEGIILRDSMDLSQSGFRHMHFEGAWGIPFFIQMENQYRFGALVLDGASPTLRSMTFSDVNTSSVLATNLAQPTFIGGEYVAGNDGESGVTGQAVQVYGGGTPASPMIFRDATFQSTNRGCSNQDGGRSAIWASQTFIKVERSFFIGGDFGLSIRNSAGEVSNTSIDVRCNGIDVYGTKGIGSTVYNVKLSNNVITTIDRTPITAYQGADVLIENNELSGAIEGSGIAIRDSNAQIHGNDIGPIGGWNGLWLLGNFDVIAENNSILNTAKEAVLAGEYGNNAPSPTQARLYLANNTISTQGNGDCSSSRWWGGSFTCPLIMAHRTGVTAVDNSFGSEGIADGVRATGAILDFRRNTFATQGTGAILQNFDSGFTGQQEYGTLAFFSGNEWNDVGVTYNVSKSAVTVQSEYIPSPPDGENPVVLSWDDQEAWVNNGWQNGIIPHQVKSCPTCVDYTPHNFPLAINMDNNSTVFTFSNLTNLDLSKINIETQPTKYAVQVQRAELVRFQTLVNGQKVPNANVLIEDALGNDLYSLETNDDGYTPWFSLASNFHLDFRGLADGDNPDGFADDQYEDSCSDGLDNDGDLLLDVDDPDCDYSAGTRELSLYRYTAYRFGYGFVNGEFTLTDTTYQDTLNLENNPPSVSVVQNDGESFRRVVTLTGSAYDGTWAGIYETDELAQWDQKGYVHRVEIKDPFTSDWNAVGYAIDASGSEPGYVSRNNHPFSNWYYEYDMSNRQEGDYTFEFRAFDGLEYSPIITRTVKVNTQAPTISVTSPSTQSSHSDGTVTFEGTAHDPYGCPFNCGVDIDQIYFQIEGPNYNVLTSTEGGTDWSWTWDFSGLPRDIATYTFTIWASDSDFCRGEIDECQVSTIELQIDTHNSPPFIRLTSPQNGQIYSASEQSIISGVARDNDGDITRVDVEVLDVANGYINIFTGVVTEIASNGYWELEWNSEIMNHNMQYIIKSRSYDGYAFSDWTEVQIVADNPPDKENNRPTFDSTNWQTEIVLYCEVDTTSQNPCTTAELNLLDFFDDIDGVSDLILSVYDDPARTTDDDFGLVINIGIDGKAFYDPKSMGFYDENMLTWSLNNVIFLATDPTGSKEISTPVSFTVSPIEFTVNNPDITTADPQEIITFTGTGLPGKTVRVSLGGTQVNSTVVSEDSSWELGIPGSILSKPVNPTFSISGSDSITGAIISPNVGESGIGADLIIIIIISVVALLGAILFFSGVISFEEEEDDVQSESIDSEQSGELVQSDEHPGWLWDSINEEWVPDPNHLDE